VMCCWGAGVGGAESSSGGVGLLRARLKGRRGMGRMILGPVVLSAVSIFGLCGSLSGCGNVPS